MDAFAAAIENVVEVWVEDLGGLMVVRTNVAVMVAVAAVLKYCQEGH